MQPALYGTLALCFALCVSTLRAQDIEGAEVETYKQIGDVKLNMHIFYPDGHQPENPRPAIVFFFGGGWRSGTPTQFQHHCRYLAERGMVAMAADYRVSSRHDVKAAACVADAKSAIRWVRREAKRLGVDPQRIAAGGGSAGGHLAASTALLPGLDEPDEDENISSKPNALVLFNPAVVLAPVAGDRTLDNERLASLADRFGVEPREISPFHHVVAGAPPCIIFHGKADTTVAYRTVELFTDAMQKEGNRCELMGYDEQAHGFFNYGRSQNEFYKKTVQQMDRFLTSLEYLQPVAAENK